MENNLFDKELTSGTLNSLLETMGQALEGIGPKTSCSISVLLDMATTFMNDNQDCFEEVELLECGIELWPKEDETNVMALSDSIQIDLTIEDSRQLLEALSRSIESDEEAMHNIINDFEGEDDIVQAYGVLTRLEATRKLAKDLRKALS